MCHCLEFFILNLPNLLRFFLSYMCQSLDIIKTLIVRREGRMDLRKKQLELQVQSVENLQEKYEKRLSKKSGKTKSLETFQSLYLKKIGDAIKAERKEHFPAVISKLYKSDANIKAIKKKFGIKPSYIDDKAKEISTKLLTLIDSKKIFYIHKDVLLTRYIDCICRTYKKQ